MRVVDLCKKVDEFVFQGLEEAYVVLTREELEDFTRQFPNEDVVCLEQHVPLFMSEVNEDLPDGEQT